MKLKLITGTVLTLFLIGMLTLVFNIQLVRPVETSTLTPHSPIYVYGDSGFVPANGVTGGSGLSEDPYIIEGWDIDASQDAGILISNTRAYFIIRNVFIHDGYIDGGHHGISFSNVTNGEVSGASITRNANGIHLSSSLNNVISGNNITANNAMGISLSDSSNNTVISGNNITENTNGIFLDSSSSNTISENNITNSNSWGVSIKSSSDNTILNNNMENNFGGISLSYSSGHEIALNNIMGASMGSHGIMFLYSSNNTIFGNNITNNHDRGIYSQFSSNNNISKNKVANNGQNGIDLDTDSNFNIVSENNIIDNVIDGIHLTYSSNNTIYHNNFIDNGDQTGISEDPEFNIWDNGIEGNYYSDYTGVDLNHDGIGDTPHVINANNTDYYPLMGMFSDFEATPEHHVQTVCNSTVSDFLFEHFTPSEIRVISFNVMGEDGTTGFCRICIPTALMNEPYTVLVNATEVSYNLLPFSNQTHSYLYFTYSHSKQQVIIIPEFPSFLFLPLFIMATLPTVVYAKKRKKA